MNSASFERRSFARPSPTSRFETFGPNTIGASLVVSVPAAIAQSICPVAIFAPATIAACRDVPHAWLIVIAGVLGSSRVCSVASRARFQSRECEMTAPAFTSPSRSPSSAQRSTIASRTVDSILRFDSSA